MHNNSATTQKFTLETRVMPKVYFPLSLPFLDHRNRLPLFYSSRTTITSGNVSVLNLYNFTRIRGKKAGSKEQITKASKEKVTRKGASKEKINKKTMSKESRSDMGKKKSSQNKNTSNSKELPTRTVGTPERSQMSKQGTRSAAASSKKNKTEDEVTKDEVHYNDDMLNKMSKALTHHNWYHGLMPRDEIEDLLKVDGDFLVRKTEVAKQPRYAISVIKGLRIRHILLNFKDEMWSLRDLKKPTLTELIEAHRNDKVPVMADGTILVNGVDRPPFYILHEHIELKKKLGGGNFGEVYSAQWKKSEGEVIDVAVKRLKGMMKKKQRADFVKEAKLMRRFDHPNIVKVYGVAPQEEPVMIVLEMASGGCLHTHLRSSVTLTNDQLLGYCIDACRGMCYLSGRNVIHRDIAARNCLMGAKGEVKISDFGLSVADRSEIKLDKLKSMPVKWLAPETLKNGVFSKKSDVWSFGVLVWEVFTRCEQDPYHGLSNHKAKEKILAGGDLKLPDTAPPLGSAVMNLCFTLKPDDRPEFDGLFRLLAPNEKPPNNTDAMFETYAT
uniref:Tyrosine-protein kinase n=1 Tax=Bursaphelenchus xylophilus TaxID=6326 RepID=A0A1I7S3K4_BURXY